MTFATTDSYCPTVTIGISAYNESATIVRNVGSLFLQKGDFLIERVIIYSDGSTDDTPAKLRMLAELFPKVTVVISSEQKGKAFRLNQLFNSNKSEIVMIFDADLLVTDAFLLHKLTRPFADESIGIVSSNNQYLSSGSWLSSVVATSEEIWYRARKDIGGGDNFYNNSGSAVALSSALTNRVRLPVGCIDDQHMLYYFCIKHGFSFNFVPNALTFCVAPGTLADILAHHQRTEREEVLDEEIQNVLGERMHIGLREKLVAIVSMFMKKPILTLLAILYLVTTRIIPIGKDVLTTRGLWSRLSSTKQAFSSDQYMQAKNIANEIL